MAAPAQPDNADRAALQGASVIVALTGGIAAYKTCWLVSRLAQAGAEVTVIMTQDATRFVTPLTFQALSGKPVYTSQWEHVENKDPQHIGLARRADLAIVAPCTMNTMAKIAHGIADDIVTVVLSAIDRAKTPVLLAPAMNEAMWGQASTQRNAKQLIEDGFELVGPAEGWQACRTVGAGRMVEPEQLLDEVAKRIAAKRAS